MSADANPYASPQVPGDPSARRPQTSRGVQIVVGVALTVGCAVLFAAVGGLVAAGLNRFAPGYYPSVFSGPARGGYASSVGVGTGILQGLLVGFLVGIVVAAGLGWLKQLQVANSLRALGIVATVALGFAAAGTLFGYAMGTLLPDYYRGVFHGGRQPDFSPVDVGIGLGCSEGLMLGAAMGTLAALALAWRSARRIRCAAPPACSCSTTPCG